MPYLDTHVMMTLRLGQWSQDHTLRAFEIEREIAMARQCKQPVSKKRSRRFSLGNLKMLWTSTA
ncbi:MULTISPECIES: hypothetical protein [Ruegeria]|uniref:Uncharacterized protein n=1 Tax=Ruegeria atlantica TaxID=81569 RepID=A0AA90ZHK0_9RHOB|nr:MULTISPECIES: hypothetical protein [Ruegeria]MCA0908224.1 hypothetical protein [Ruegeria marisrubri]NOC47299.1 hypothetical protein [Ruegeria sp. HKCCD7559]NOC85258.1 hypothetical protein [Ruegeria sp. HKCCD6428]NOC92243.1 hypothetical protein [Ruegeria sp. HKCCD6604]NOD32407.1 hypothetical protein [Ruegeria atlantica]